MRLWHFALLPYLDDKHIIAQYRELLAIKGAIDKNGTPNHRLVNKVLDYPITDFKWYFIKVKDELNKRNIKFNNKKAVEVYNWHSNKFSNPFSYIWRQDMQPYETWHNDRYLTQCYYNLQEKYDCGIVSQQAWQRIDEFYKKEMCKDE